MDNPGSPHGGGKLFDGLGDHQVRLLQNFRIITGNLLEEPQVFVETHPGWHLGSLGDEVEIQGRLSAVVQVVDINPIVGENLILDLF